MADLTWARGLSAGIAAVVLLAACQPGKGHQAAAGSALTASERADLRWPVIPGLAGTACNLVPPAAIRASLAAVHGVGPRSTSPRSISLHQGTDGGGNPTCTEAWSGGREQFVVDFIRRGDQSRSYEASELEPRRYEAGLPSEIYATFASGSGPAVTVTVPYKAGYLQLTGRPGLDVGQLTGLLRIALVRATRFAPH